VNYDDETLMAYADGELDAAKRAEIAEALRQDPELARRVARHEAVRAQVAGAYSSVLDSPVPKRLLDTAQRTDDAASSDPAARRGTVVPFPGRPARAPAMRWRLREWGAMAASLAIGAVISWKLFAPTDSGLITARNGGLVASGSLARALDSQLASAQTGDEPVLIGLSFLARDHRYCRSFAVPAADTAGLACRVDGEWRIPVTAAAPAGEGLRQATSPPPAVMELIQARIAGEALDAAGEESARRAGWQAGATPPRD